MLSPSCDTLHTPRPTHLHRRPISEEQWKEMIGDSPVVPMPVIDMQGNMDAESIARALHIIHTVLALGGSRETPLAESTCAFDKIWLQKQGELASFSARGQQEESKQDDKPHVFIPAVAPLPPAVRYAVTGRNSVSSVDILPPHHAVISAPSIHLLQFIEAIARNQFDSLALFDSFRFLDQEPGVANDVLIERLKEYKLLRFCGEAGMGKSTVFPLAFARAMRDKERHYTNIALTVNQKMSQFSQGIRVTYSRKSGRWLIQRVGGGDTNPYKFDDHTLHFLDVPDFQNKEKAQEKAEDYEECAQAVFNATIDHKNSKTIMLSSLQREMVFTKQPEADKQMPLLLSKQGKLTPITFPLVYSPPLSYPAQFITYIQSTLLRRYGVTFSHGAKGMVEPDGLYADLKKLDFSFYQQYFPQKQQQVAPQLTRQRTKSTISYHLKAASFVSLPGLISQRATEDTNWHKAPTDKTALEDTTMLNSVAETRQRHLETFDKIIGEIRDCLGDTADQAGSKDDALTQITQLLDKPPTHPSEKQKGELKAKIRSLESLYFDIQATLPWTKFKTTLKASVTQLAYFAPVLRKMQDALNKSLHTKLGYRQPRGSRIRVADRIYGQHKAKQEAGNGDNNEVIEIEVFKTTTLPSLLTHSSDIEFNEADQIFFPPGQNVEINIHQALLSNPTAQLTVWIAGEFHTLTTQHVLHIMDASDVKQQQQQSNSFVTSTHYSIFTTPGARQALGMSEAPTDTAWWQQLAEKYQLAFPQKPPPGHTHVVFTSAHHPGSDGFLVMNLAEDKPLHFIAFEVKDRLKNKKIQLGALNYPQMAFFANTLEKQWSLTTRAAPSHPNDQDGDKFRLRFAASDLDARIAFAAQFVCTKTKIPTKEQVQEMMKISIAGCPWDTTDHITDAIATGLRARWVVKGLDKGNELVPGFAVIQTSTSSLSLHWADLGIPLTAFYHPTHLRSSPLSDLKFSWSPYLEFHGKSEETSPEAAKE